MMEQQVDHYNPAELTNEKKENISLGIIGALLFSLAGGLVFFLLDQLGYIASISGFVAIWAAFFGYGLFSGNKNSIKGCRSIQCDDSCSACDKFRDVEGLRTKRYGTRKKNN